MTASQRAMATAVIYPEPAKLKRKGGYVLGTDQGVSANLLMKARAVLNTEFVTPILEGNKALPGEGVSSGLLAKARAVDDLEALAASYQIAAGSKARLDRRCNVLQGAGNA